MIGPITIEQRRALIGASTFAGYYENEVERDSAYEMLKKRAEVAATAQTAQAPPPDEPAPKPKKRSSTSRRSSRQTPIEAATNSAARSIGSSLGRSLTRGILGSLFGKK